MPFGGAQSSMGRLPLGLGAFLHTICRLQSAPLQPGAWGAPPHAVQWHVRQPTPASQLLPGPGPQDVTWTTLRKSVTPKRQESRPRHCRARFAMAAGVRTHAPTHVCAAKAEDKEEEEDQNDLSWAQDTLARGRALVAPQSRKRSMCSVGGCSISSRGVSSSE